MGWCDRFPDGEKCKRGLRDLLFIIMVLLLGFLLSLWYIIIFISPIGGC